VRICAGNMPQSLASVPGGHARAKTVADGAAEMTEATMGVSSQPMKGSLMVVVWERARGRSVARMKSEDGILANFLSNIK